MPGGGMPLHWVGCTLAALGFGCGPLCLIVTTVLLLLALRLLLPLTLLTVRGGRLLSGLPVVLFASVGCALAALAGGVLSSF